MAKKTLLEMTQEILSSMDGDEVNSITDTTEAEQVARLIIRSYEDFIVNYDIPELKSLFNLTALGDTSKPSHMQVPSNIDNIEWIKYNIRSSSDTKDKYVNIDFVKPDEFIHKVINRDSSASNITTVTDNGIKLYIRNDKRPEYYTSFDDNYLVFDSHDSSVDNTLQASKTTCYGKTSPTVSLTDSYIPTLDSNLFPLLINEAKSLAFVELKQQANQKAEQQSRRQAVKMQNNRSKLDNTPDRPDYGRR